MRGKYILLATAGLYAIASTSAARADTASVEMALVTAEGIGEKVGTVSFKDSEKGLEITPVLHSLPPGAHGFHIHENPSCGAGEKDGKIQAAIAAGGHLDPAKSGAHAGPAGSGHLGDLPTLTVAPNGEAKLPVIAPRLKVSDIRGHSVMIHAGSDNYSDTPEKLGGGGARIACGVVAK